MMHFYIKKGYWWIVDHHCLFFLFIILTLQQKLIKENLENQKQKNNKLPRPTNNGNQLCDPVKGIMETVNDVWKLKP